MDDEITIFERFFRAELLTVSELSTCISGRLSNTVGTSKAVFPRAIFNVVPLDDKTGQARTHIQTRLLVDFKIFATLPLPATIGPAVMAVKEHFRESRTFDFEGHRISVRHERPIAFVEKGATADEKIITRGGTYRAWVSRA